MATRGKEIQDFIKSQKKTARERFEEAGWVFNENDWIIKYKKGNLLSGGLFTFIIFNKENKTVYAEELYEPMEIDVETLKLIIAQCKELGWL